MFNKTTVTPPSVTVNIPAQKAHVIDPTQAAQFYGECVDKAQKAVAEATVIKFGAQNEFTAVKVAIEGNFEKNTRRARLIYKLNGLLFDLTIEDLEDAARDAVYEEIARNLAAKILQQMLSRRFP